MNPYIFALQIISITSMVGSASVILTLILFSDMRKKLFMQIIAFISIADFIGNTPYASARRPPTHSFACKVEGFLNLYFYPVSWAWTTILVYFLYSLALHGKLPLSKLKIHVLCWGVPLFLCLITLTTNPFGREGSDTSVCSYGGPALSGYVWHMIVYYGFWVFCVTCMCVMYWIIIDQKKQNKVRNLSILKLATDSLYLYPLIMFCCWLLRVISASLQFRGDDNFQAFDTVNCISDGLKIFHGWCAAAIFFYKSAEARQRWYGLVIGVAVMLGLATAGRAPTVDRSSIVSDFSLEYEQTEEDLLTLATDLKENHFMDNVFSPHHSQTSRQSMEIS